ncbi:MAG: DUF6186 family protein [Aquiluna sp.]|nr:DUF6186 family protein [Aquiluna sp.]MCF8545767.1 DUF6186 family protein [Aquiluna sp.]
MSPEVMLSFAYLLFVAIAVVLASFGTLRPEKFTPLSQTLKFIMRHRITRISLFLVWWWLGWHFFVGVTIR